jgi:hypothetical protein
MTDVIVSDPVPPSSHEPPGTVSQRIRYRDASGIVLAVAHQFLRPDGSIGGRDGRPDPKILMTPRGRLYTRHADEELCDDCPPHIRARLNRSGAP